MSEKDPLHGLQNIYTQTENKHKLAVKDIVTLFEALLESYQTRVKQPLQDEVFSEIKRMHDEFREMNVPPPQGNVDPPPQSSALMMFKSWRSPKWLAARRSAGS